MRLTIHIALLALVVGAARAMTYKEYVGMFSDAASTDEMRVFAEKNSEATPWGAQIPEHAIRLNNVDLPMVDAGHIAGMASHLKRIEAAKFHPTDADNNGNMYGQLGQQFAALRAKAIMDAAVVGVLYQVPVYTEPNIYSGCEAYAYGAPIPSNVMRPQSFGRIHPVGAFTDSEASKEYFLLACPLLDGRPLDNQVRVFRTSFKRLTAWDNYVWYEALIELSIPSLGFFFNHTHTGYAIMDANSTICGYKIAFQRLELRDPAPETQTDTVLNARIASLCTNVVANCANTTELIPDDDRYTSVADCITFNSVSARKARNGYQYVDQDSIKCREFHLGLIGQSIARNQPDHQAKHCTHSGPRGGGKCVSHPFDSFQNDVVACQAQ
jgi:hypothetical protein